MQKVMPIRTAGMKGTVAGDLSMEQDQRWGNKSEKAGTGWKAQNVSKVGGARGSTGRTKILQGPLGDLHGDGTRVVTTKKFVFPS